MPSVRNCSISRSSRATASGRPARNWASASTGSDRGVLDDRLVDGFAPNEEQVVEDRVERELLPARRGRELEHLGLDPVEAEALPGREEGASDLRRRPAGAPRDDEDVGGVRERRHVDVADRERLRRAPGDESGSVLAAYRTGRLRDEVGQRGVELGEAGCVGRDRLGDVRTGRVLQEPAAREPDDPVDRASSARSGRQGRSPRRAPRARPSGRAPPSPLARSDRRGRRRPARPRSRRSRAKRTSRPSESTTSFATIVAISSRRSGCSDVRCPKRSTTTSGK